MDEVHNCTSGYFSNFKKEGNSPIENTDLLQKIRSKHQESLNLSEEKICISKQMLDMLENQIQKINIELNSFKKDLKADVNGGGEGREDSYKRRKLEKGASLTTSIYDEELAQLDFESTYDAVMGSEMREPDKKYCYCQKDSPEEMIGCDNPGCKREWFHFSCVGLSSKPTGTWYCPDCLKEEQN
eukprot:CAMPEP_0202944202 /NCGR_PEP_ID=MMETSP1395-20130829/4919_1 /ASSEMBLY_ACC=CAM_ASM_000871 /TAXON_ID=5961 /ORGANISM="Blepharisma japonicum, Strain Stock R1072" /LENGTH=184 /DNA_ID=CAMNT_0049642683 /DNA_START=88 /DNA_END=642 /DNA_ORIENTATION=-